MALSLIFNGLRNPDYLRAFQNPGMWNKDTWLAMVYPSHGEALVSSFTFLRDHFVCDQLLFRFLTSCLLFQEYIFFQGVCPFILYTYISISFSAMVVLLVLFIRAQLRVVSLLFIYPYQKIGKVIIIIVHSSSIWISYLLRLDDLSINIWLLVT